MKKKDRCRHHRIWVFASPNSSGVSWCYECGAIRINSAGEKWTKPVGKDGINPAMREIKK